MQTNRAVSAQPAAVGPTPGLPAAPVNGLQLQRLTQAIRGLTGEQLTWASGYLAGLAVGRPALAAAPVAAAGTARLTILYASQTGNARSVAEALGRQAAARQLAHRVVSVADFRPRDLAKEQFVLLVISTQGEGEPPEAALELHRVLFGQGAPTLTGLGYGVFGSLVPELHINSCYK
ncbi:flavodoxin domain-containing protein [uncultured Lamprocystis sp.]|jgi:sulfite reductase (NADPH) flavoprotein alpha-component|uniref:flavodoxin domain-containing protein n=1 Tax=uncultured Lamprocystis sp. TaxID=543132 RepID=UPI0025FA32F8|nr:flavodoxin domain-containing protein [uncultured Lamprocystis sp.]